MLLMKLWILSSAHGGHCLGILLTIIRRYAAVPGNVHLHLHLSSVLHRDCIAALVHLSHSGAYWWPGLRWASRRATRGHAEQLYDAMPRHADVPQHYGHHGHGPVRTP